MNTDQELTRPADGMNEAYDEVQRMPGMTLRRMAHACGGVLHIAGDELQADTEVTMITTDSREACEGCLFGAIVGEHSDGHQYIPNVFEAGALGVISEQELPDAAGCWIKVASTIEALGAIAEYYLSVMQIPVVGITGSVGKTSTKEAIASVLAQRYRVLKTAGNFNNELGVPLTIFRLRPGDEIAVIEMGISHFGEMHVLARIVRPDTCVITNIGDCHLEFLGSRDGVLRAKSEIFDFLSPEGHIVLNGDDQHLRRIREAAGVKPVFYGLIDENVPAGLTDSGAGAAAEGNTAEPEADPVHRDFFADHICPQGLEGISCRLHMPPAGVYESLLDTAGDGPVWPLAGSAGSSRASAAADCDGAGTKPAGQTAIDVRIPMPGRHMVMNALAAAAVGRIYGLTDDQIRAGLESIAGVSGRFHIIRTGHYTLIDDCYNANPMSVKASLSILHDAQGAGMGRRVAILGDMGELGDEEVRLHEEVGTYAAGCGLSVLIAVGELSEHLAGAASVSSGSPVWTDGMTEEDEATDANRLQILHFDSVDAFIESAQAGTLPLEEGDTILVKASHFMHFERILETLQD